MALPRTVAHSSSERGAFSTLPFVVIVVATEFQMVSAAGSTRPFIKSLIVVVGRYSASGFCFAQLKQNKRETKAVNNGSRRMSSVHRQARDVLPPEVRAAHKYVSDRPAARVQPFIWTRKAVQLYPRALAR